MLTETRPTTTVLIYFRRHPSLTLQQFYHHWENVHARIVAPWMEKHGWIGYRQIQVTGTISKNTTSALPHFPEDDFSTSEDTPELHHFDGIAFFEVQRHVNFIDAFSDPYYAAYIEPDENTFIDKLGLGGGLLAAYEGRTVTLLDHGVSVIGDKADPERKVWREFESKATSKISAERRPSKEFRARL